jgi:UDP-glucose 4-epimerase
VADKPVCLIGGGGFIGSALRRHLAARQVTAVILGRAPMSDARENEIHVNLAEHSWDDIRASLGRFEYAAIIDLAYASVPNSSFADPARDVAENLGGVLRHLELCAQLRTEKFVYVSSGGTIYGEGEGRPHKEGDPLFPLSPYGITKLACERYVHLYHRIHRLPAIIIRPSNIYGPGQRPFRGQGIVSTAFGAAFDGRPCTVFGDGGHVRDYLFVDDLCEAIDAIVAHADAGSILNVGSGEGLQVIELLRMIEQLVQEKGGSLELAFEPPRPFDVHYNVLDVSRLHAIAPWRPRTALRDGLAQTRDWVEQFLTDRSSPL